MGEHMIEEAKNTGSESALEGLSHALDWLRQNNAAELVTVFWFSHLSRRPRICFHELATMRRLLPGVPASVELRDRHERWIAISDGIEFEASAYYSEPRQAVCRSEVL